MNSSLAFVWNRDLRLLCFNENFLEKYSRATVRKKGEIRTQNVEVVGERKTRDEFISGKP